MEYHNSLAAKLNEVDATTETSAIVECLKPKHAVFQQYSQSVRDRFPGADNYRNALEVLVLTGKLGPIFTCIDNLTI
jgi:hypothetical protein